jgi:hypothetical protein
MAMAHPDNGCVMKVSKYGDKAEVISSGVRAANGMGASPDGQMITVADNQGHWVPASPIFIVKPNAFFGYHGDPRRFSKADYAEHQKRFPKTDPPLCWVPYFWDNSAGSQVWAPQNFGPLSGKMLHTSYGKCALLAVLPEKVDNIDQAAVVPFNLKFDSGIMRGRVNPADNTLYLAGLHGWQTSAVKHGCLTRIRYTGKPFNLPTDFHVIKDGVQITFPLPLDKTTAADDGSYSFEAWQYQSTSTYGSADYKVTDPKSKGRDSFDVKKATLSPDGKTITLQIEDIRPVQQYLIKCNLNAADGTPIKCQVAGTINVMPK